MTQTNEIDKKYSYGKIWKIAYPILISLVMEQLIGMTDTAFLGRVGEIEIGASALAGVYYMVIFMLGLGFSIGVQIIIGRRNGEGSYRLAGEAFWQGLYFLLGLAVLITAASEWLSPKIMGLIISSDNIFAASLSYVRWRVMGLIFGFSTAMFRAFYIGTTQTKTLSINSLVMLISNVLFNWVLIFGKFGFPALGIAGAAIGSTLAELVSLIFFIIYTSRHCDTKKFGLDRPARASWRTMKSLFSVSGWTMIQNFISISTWFIFFLFIEHTGERALAVSNIIRSISGLIWMVLMAFASTCSTLVSNAIGEGREDLVVPLVSKLLRLSYILVIPVLFLFSLFPELIVRIYTNIPDWIVDTVPSLWVLCASYLLTVPAMIFFQATSGTGNTKSAFALEGVALVVYTLYCAIIIGWLKMDVAVCWSAEAVYGATMTIVCGLYLKSRRWIGRAL